MDLIPAIDLMNGKCVRLFKGDFNKRKDFTKEPHEQAKFWESEGAKYIHIVDLDAAKTGSPTNDKSIKKIAQTVNIPIQIGGGIRSQERIEQLFSYGIEKVIMGTSAIENKELVRINYETATGKYLPFFKFFGLIYTCAERTATVHFYLDPNTSSAYCNECTFYSSVLICFL